MQDETRCLAEGKAYLLIQSQAGYQIWQREDYDNASVRRKLPIDEFVLSEVGRRTAVQAFGRFEPTAAARYMEDLGLRVNVTNDTHLPERDIETKSVRPWQMCVSVECEEIGLPTNLSHCPSCGSATSLYDSDLGTEARWSAVVAEGLEIGSMLALGSHRHLKHGSGLSSNKSSWRRLRSHSEGAKLLLQHWSSVPHACRR
jgi:hypothetical protein